MENITKPKEKEVIANKTRRIFGIVRNRENFQNSVKASLAFSTGEMAKAFPDLRQAQLTKDKAIIQSHCMTRLL
jgi:hypothetical protein